MTTEREDALTLRSTHLKWATAAAAVAVLVGASSYYAGWKTNVEQSAIEHAQVQKVLREHDPLVQKVQDEAALDTMQQARIANLENSVASLVGKMDKLTDLLIDRENRDRWKKP